MKEKVLHLLRVMGRSDSKIDSKDAEQELIEILEKFIAKKCEFENKMEIYTDDVATEIYNISDPGFCREMPEIIYCNDCEFEFYTEWFDIDWESYFKETMDRRKEYYKKRMEEHKQYLKNIEDMYQKYSEIKFDDIKYILEEN